MKKRVISMAIALCMLVALLPSIPLVSADNGYTFVYDFNPNKISAATPTVDQKTEFGSEYAQTHNLWDYVSKNTSTVRGYSFGAKYGWQIQPGGIDDSKYLVLEINIPVAGVYTATYEYGTHKVGGYGNIHLIPPSVTDIATAISSGSYKINSSKIDYCKGNANATGGYSETYTVNVAASGKYKLVLSADSYNDYPAYAGNKYVNMYPCSLTLSSGNGAIPMELSASCNEILAGESEEITLSGYMSDGTGFAASKVDSIAYTVKDGNPDVASVDANGKVKGIKTGTEVITVTATAGTYTISDEVKIEVDDIVTNGNYTFKYDFNPKKITSDGNPYVDETELFGSEYAQTYNMWQYLSKTTGAVRGYSFGKQYGWQISSNAPGNYVAVELNIPEPGKYTATYIYGAHTVGATGDLYLLPPSVTDIAAGIADDTYKLNSEPIDYDQGV
ncbi:MAG: Ig-like domain-containing protein, partial [Oscillospiraceae bacterium]|nr:Ig-like domain-containing protein [Oscillospiraceae bacterium]